MHSVLRSSLLAASLAALVCGQTPPSQIRAEGMPPRATPGDYQSHKEVGNITIAADFAGHFVTTPEKNLTTEDWVVVEVALFGPAGTKLQLSPDQFSLRINEKKNPIPSEPSVRVNSNLRDPDWESPDQAAAKQSKTAINTGGGGRQDNSPPPPVHIPLELQRSMAEKALKASLAEGDRALPQAGLLYFRYGGKTKGIHSIQLIYNGPAGQTSLELQPLQ